MNHDSYIAVTASLNGQQFTDVTNRREIDLGEGRKYTEAINMIRYYRHPFYILNLAGTAAGGDRVVLRGSDETLKSALDSTKVIEVRFTACVLLEMDKFTAAVEGKVVRHSNKTLDIECISPKVPQAALAKVDLVFRDDSFPPRCKPITFPARYKFQFFPAPELTSIQPFGGPITGGTQIIVAVKNISPKAHCTLTMFYEADDDTNKGAAANPLMNQPQAMERARQMARQGSRKGVVSTMTVPATYYEKVNKHSSDTTLIGCFLCKAPTFPLLPGPGGDTCCPMSIKVRSTHHPPPTTHHPPPTTHHPPFPAAISCTPIS